MNKKRNRGMTMVEILVAFVMLTLVMGIAYGSIRFASNLTTKAADIDRDNERFVRSVSDYFSDDDHYKVSTMTDVTYSFSGVASDGSTTGPYTFKAKTVKVPFEDDGLKYNYTSDDTGDNVRSIYIFSTAD